MAEPWRVGHGAAPLDVPVGTPLGGYAARKGDGTGVLDPLEAGAVAFVDSAGAVAVLCVVDVLQVDHDLATTCRAVVAEAVGTDAGLVWVTATHTHAGPEPGLLDADVVSAVGTAAVEAVRAAVPARVTRHRGELDGVDGQRSGSDRRTTVPVDVLRVSAPGGRPVGLLGVVPVHPTVLPAANRQVSADLVGAARRALAPELDGAWSLIATGAAGDVSTRPHRRGQTPRELARLGGLVAASLVAAAGDEALVEAAGRLDGRVDTLALEAAEPDAPFRAGAADAARTALSVARARGDLPAARDAEVTLQGAALGPRERGGPVPCAVAGLDLGGVRLLGLGGEPFLALGAVEGDPVLLGYANGYCGYLPTADAFTRPEYEVLVARVAPGEAERARAAAVALLG